MIFDPDPPEMRIPALPLELFIKHRFKQSLNSNFVPKNFIRPFRKPVVFFQGMSLIHGCPFAVVQLSAPGFFCLNFYSFLSV
jgi:hypothetical protein